MQGGPQGPQGSDRRGPCSSHGQTLGTAPLPRPGDHGHLAIPGASLDQAALVACALTWPDILALALPPTCQEPARDSLAAVPARG